LEKRNYIYFSFQGDIPYDELLRLKCLKPERVFILVFSSRIGKKMEEFEVFPMDLTRLGATLSEIINDSDNREKHLMGNT